MGMEQLRRSLPLLDYLYSICRVESEGTLEGGKIRIRYWLIAEKLVTRMDKQTVRPVSTVKNKVVYEHKGIKVNFFSGKPRINLHELYNGK